MGLLQDIDTEVNNLVGVRPFMIIGKAVRTFGPASVARRVAGIPTPGDVVERAQDDVDSRLQGMGRGVPPPPRLPF